MKYIKLILFTIIFLLVPFCYSMGLSTHNLRDTIFFTPNLEKTYSHAFITNCGFTQDYEAYVRMQQGSNLTKYVTVEPSYFKDIPDKSRTLFTANLKLPEKIEKPGFHEIRVGVRETQSLSGGVFGVRTGAEATITIIVLYPYKYIEWSFSTQNVNVNETATFTINIQNFGEPVIEKAKATIKIYNPEEKLVKTAFSDSKTIMPSKTEILTATFSTKNMEAGEYKAVAILDYDGNKTTKNASFLIGILNVDLIDYTKQFIENSTDKMEIKVKSGWNSKIENIYADVNILDKENRIIEEKSFKTVSETLESWETKTLVGYFNTFGLKPDNYSISITLNYNDVAKTEFGDIEITKAEMPEKEKPSFIEMISNTTTLFIVIAVLLIANIIWMLLRKRKRK